MISIIISLNEKVLLQISLGYVNSYRRTQMNLRGWSYWMLPSQPVSRLGHSRLAKVGSQKLVPDGASMSLSSLHL